MGNASSGPWFTNDQCGKTIVRGTVDAGINNIIYMELHSGPKIANSTCGKTIVAGTIHRGSTVFTYTCHRHVALTVATRSAGSVKMVETGAQKAFCALDYAWTQSNVLCSKAFAPSSKSTHQWETASSSGMKNSCMTGVSMSQNTQNDHAVVRVREAFQHSHRKTTKTASLPCGKTLHKCLWVKPYRLKLLQALTMMTKPSICSSVPI